MKFRIWDIKNKQYISDKESVNYLISLNGIVYDYTEGGALNDLFCEVRRCVGFTDESKQEICIKDLVHAKKENGEMDTFYVSEENWQDLKDYNRIVILE